MSAQARLEPFIAGRPEQFAVACLEALKALEAAGDVRDADRALRDIATALADLVSAHRPAARVVCIAPNCAGHRDRA
jgi:hypothetical protein